MNIGKAINKIPVANIWATGFFSLVFLCLFLLWLFIFNPVVVHTPEIKYIGMQPDEIRDINNMISQVKPLYFNTARSITFVNESYDLNVLFYGPAGGVNYMLGTIKIKWTRDMDWNRQVICHELSHNFLMGKEKFTYDLMETEFCFDEYKRLEVNLE